MQRLENCYSQILWLITVNQLNLCQHDLHSGCLTYFSHARQFLLVNTINLILNEADTRHINLTALS